MSKQPLALIILDGYGMRKEIEGNAVKQADTPYFDALWKEYPHQSLQASGKHVGLPRGQMGNSEVGHMNIGAGRVVHQMITRIDDSFKNGDFSENLVFKKTLQNVKDNNGNLHLFGLLSDGGVHSHMDHLFNILDLIKDFGGIKQTYLHLATDGRDVGPYTGAGYISQLEEKIVEIQYGKIASLTGRFYAMDRDNRWERIEKAYRAIVDGVGEEFSNASEAIEKSYQEGVSDEFITPKVMVENGNPVATLQENDAFLFWNFRPDRVVQLSKAIMSPDFDAFDRLRYNENLQFTTMTEYAPEIPADILFEEDNLENVLGQVLSEAGLNQLRMAETEKYPHVTYFLNGGRRDPFENEDQVLIPSPQVLTYDLQPEMSAFEVAERFVSEMDKDTYDVVILNFANPDMVGHSGNLQAAIKAVEAVDKALQQVVDALFEKDGTALIIADHGNSEMMLTPEGTPHTAHTTSPVPLIVTDKKWDILKGGRLADIAPTLLDILNIEQPIDMTGHSLLIEKEL